MSTETSNRQVSLPLAAVEVPLNIDSASGSTANQVIKDGLGNVNGVLHAATASVTNDTSGGLAIVLDGDLLVAEGVGGLVNTVAGQGADRVPQVVVNGNNGLGQVKTTVVETTRAETNGVVSHVAVLDIGTRARAGASRGGGGGRGRSRFRGVGSGLSGSSGGGRGLSSSSGQDNSRHDNDGSSAGAGAGAAGGRSSLGGLLSRRLDDQGGRGSSSSRVGAGAGSGLEEFTRRSRRSSSGGSSLLGLGRVEGLGGGLVYLNGDSLNLSNPLDNQVALIMVMAANVAVRLGNGNRGQGEKCDGSRLHCGGLGYQF